MELLLSYVTERGMTKIVRQASSFNYIRVNAARGANNSRTIPPEKMLRKPASELGDFYRVS